ncbi:hypothetical protein D6774_01925 [Candidatus Woesearchaeota archaeon]|nr:MAG: hypothetical protein D6774_01925 [Candidatus Woesearchaeota archaeon]
MLKFFYHFYWNTEEKDRQHEESNQAVNEKKESAFAVVDVGIIATPFGKKMSGKEQNHNTKSEFFHLHNRQDTFPTTLTNPSKKNLPKISHTTSKRTNLSTAFLIHLK